MSSELGMLSENMKRIQSGARQAAFQMAFKLFSAVQGIVAFPGEPICVDPYR